MAIQLDLPFHARDSHNAGRLITQWFGNTGFGLESAAFVFPDGSINYSKTGKDAHVEQHVHSGLDFGLQRGDPLFAPADGTVTECDEDHILNGKDSGYGQMITIDHGSVITLYAHLSAFRVILHQRVKRGQEIALVGNTTRPGLSIAPHLHWSVIRPSDQNYVNPARFVTFPVQFGVTADKDGRPVRIFQTASPRSAVLRVAQPGETLACTAWRFGERRLDSSNGLPDARYYQLAAGGWVASARVQGNAPMSHPLP